MLSHLGMFAVARTAMLGCCYELKIQLQINMLFLRCGQNIGKFFLLKARCDVPKSFHLFKKKDIDSLADTLQIIDMYLKNIKNQRKVELFLLSCYMLSTALALKT